MPTAFLPDRALLNISGSDAESFLQALITTDLDALPDGEARPGALLTPQGKILFDFLVWRDGDAIALETARGQVDALVRRLSMYKLRAAVEIAASETDGVTVSWDGEAPSGWIVDHRFAKAGVMLVRSAGQHGGGDERDYDALRIENGIAVAGIDYPLQDAFPHDALLDLNGGLSFKKGCYVGQEVVSRMQHRGTARRRVATVTGDRDLPPAGTDILAGAKTVGTLGSVAGNKGLAIVRVDRVGEAMANGTPLTAGDVAVAAALPEWSGLSFPATGEEAQP
ncbi:folate-binding protein YgfZ [Rhizobiaceae bacterium n13]|uniref:Folate-binding protein YgfZ n=1 Tax=Ferirhizobium litorale TaxID=2927786 RepID=A0AAE3QAG5_9HYPH|nr:folate-binding protein YgfZ [Fererhizobium litorale]MDI7861124.1 folate-binding protein YgfZ [Fererhizobium litorale]MDI7921271.1 folate-binding protein YgfZ [Fererhizobium litorale]